MAKYLIAVLALAASALADNAAHDAGGYAAPSAYSPPVENYPPPDAYNPPADTYGAPDPYNPAPTYEQDYAPQDSYGAVDGGEDLFDLAKITELLPLFLAVFAAIIVAQLFAPLLGMLLGTKATIFGGLLAPLRGILFGIINTILGPFNLAICDITIPGAPVIAMRSFGARGFANADMVDTLSQLVLNSINAYEQ